jgi:hypothetical protein
MLSSIRTCSQSVNPIDIIADGDLCRLQKLSEEDWVAVPRTDSPQTSIHVPGLGWVCAAPPQLHLGHARGSGRPAAEANS